MSELLLDSATDESETNSPNKLTHQESNDQVVCLCRTREGTIRSNLVIEKINDMKMKLDRKVMFRKS